MDTANHNDEELNLNQSNGDKNASSVKSAYSNTIKNGSPIDRGYAWVIVFSSGMSFFFGVGFYKSFTLVYQQLLLKFGKGATATAWVTSLQSGVKLCSSPLVGAMVNRFSARSVAITGGILTGIGMILSAYAASLFALYFSYGLLAGVGLNMVHQSAFIMVGQYFKKRQGIAMGIATMFSGLGGFVIAPLLNFAFGEYGYSGTMLIFSGLMLNYIPIGAMFRPIPEKYLTGPDTITDKNNLNVTMNNSIMFTSTLSLDVPGVISTSNNSLFSKYNGNVEEQFQDIGKSVRMRNFQNKAHNVESIADKKFEQPIDGLRKPACCNNKLSLYFGLHLLKQKDLCIFMVLMFGSYLNIATVVTFLSKLCEELLNLSGKNTAIIISTCAISDIVSRPLSGAMFDTKCISKWKGLIFALIGIVNGILTIAVTFSTSYYMLFILSLLIEITTSCFHTQHIGMLSDIVGQKNLPSAIGIVRFCSGIGVMIGPTLGGLFSDLYNSYVYGYYISGCVFIVVSLLFLVYFIVDKCKAK